MPGLFEIGDPRFMLIDPVVGRAIVLRQQRAAVYRLTALSRYLELSADMGDISKEQSDGIRDQIFNTLCEAGYNPIIEMEAYLQEEKRRFPKLTLAGHKIVDASHAPETPLPKMR